MQLGILVALFTVALHLSIRHLFKGLGLSAFTAKSILKKSISYILTAFRYYCIDVSCRLGSSTFLTTKYLLLTATGRVTSVRKINFL